MAAERQDLIYGLHAVLAALSLQPDSVSEIWVDSARHDARMAQIIEGAVRIRASLHSVTQRELGELAPGARHQGAVARCKSTPVYQESDLEFLIDKLNVPPFLLMLDGVQDPHNLGACLRSADAAGVHAVIVPRDRAVSITPVVRKVASGAVEALPFFQVTNLARTLRDLRSAGLWIVGAAGDASTSLYGADLRGPLVLVLGGEGAGLRRLTRDLCDVLVHIPMSGSVASLNVSVATGICVFEALRQRSQATGLHA